MLQALILEKKSSRNKDEKEIAYCELHSQMRHFLKRWKDQRTCRKKTQVDVIQPNKKFLKRKIKIEVRASVCLEEKITSEGHRRQQICSFPVPIQSSLAEYPQWKTLRTVHCNHHKNVDRK